MSNIGCPIGGENPMLSKTLLRAVAWSIENERLGRRDSYCRLECRGR
jgi:hypothetical protein